MKQKAGILCIQLFSDCKKNCEWMEYGPEDYRYVSFNTYIFDGTNADTDEALDVQSFKSKMKS